jgi:hypothetical protein
MSELQRASAALGIPEPLVKRSAEARAAATGADVDEILAAWAGGDAPPPSATAEPEPEPEVDEAAIGEPESTEPEAEEPEPAPVPAAQPEVVVEVPEPTPLPSGAGPFFAGAAKPPVLVGRPDNPLAVLLGAIGLFLGVVFVGLVGPSLPTDPPGARSSQLPYSELAQDGGEIYTNLGCAFCHTQMVRPVIADVGLGGVSLNDTNQVLGLRRFGPDLSDVGSRISATQIEAIVGGLGDHPAHMLTPEDMAALVSYLAESQTSPDGPEPADGAEEPSEGSEEEPGA